jgi:hypothetical protein
MSVFRVVLLSFVLVAAAAAPALAQGDRAVGLVMGTPVQVGVLWHATDRVAIRPDISFSWSSSELDAASIGDIDYSSSTSSSSLSLGLALLYYLGDADNLRTYIAPRYRVRRASMSTESAIVIPGIPDGIPATDRRDTRDTQVNHSGGVSFGASYAPGARLSIFGEVGLDLAVSSGPRLGEIESTSRAIGTTAGVGVVLYF